MKISYCKAKSNIYKLFKIYKFDNEEISDILLYLIIIIK